MSLAFWKRMLKRVIQKKQSRTNIHIKHTITIAYPLCSNLGSPVSEELEDCPSDSEITEDLR